MEPLLVQKYLETCLRILKQSKEEIPVQTFLQLLDFSLDDFIDFFLNFEFQNLKIDWKNKMVLFKPSIVEEINSKIKRIKEEQKQIKTIFISYATENQSVAEQIYNLLEDDGFNCWLATENIRSSSDWVKEIVHALKNSWLIIVILSNASNKSSYVNDEVRLARKQEIPFLPIMIEEIEYFAEWFELFVERHQIFKADVPLSLKVLEDLSKTIHQTFKSQFSNSQQKSFKDKRIEAGFKQEKKIVKKKAIMHRLADKKRVVGIKMIDTTHYFLDREDSIEEIQKSLSEKGIKIISVIGRGGIGKTALVSKILQEIEDTYFIRDLRTSQKEDLFPQKELKGIIQMSTQTSGITIEKIFSYFAEMFGGDRGQKIRDLWSELHKSIEEKVADLFNFLQQGTYLVLFDNMEDLLDKEGNIIDSDLDTFFRVAINTPHNVRFLITSREQLNLKIHDLKQVRRLILNKGLPLEHGIEMLRNLDPDNSLSLANCDQEILKQIWEVTYGIPRVLEVFVSILLKEPLMTNEELIERFYELEDVNEMIKEGYRQLSLEERQIIDALAVYGRPVPKFAIDYLLKPFNKTLQIPNLLRNLVNNKMISINRENKMISLHPIDKQFAYSTIPKTGNYSKKRLEYRAANYYQKIGLNEDAWETIEDLSPQLHQITHLINAEEYDHAYKIIEKIDDDYLRLWGYIRYCVNLREELVGKLSSRGLNVKNENKMAYEWGNLGHYEKGCQIFEKNIQLFNEELKKNNPILYAETLHGVSIMHRFLAKYESALKYCSKSLAIFKQHGDKLRIAQSYCNLGEIYLFLERYKEGDQIYHKGFSYLEILDTTLSEIEKGRILSDNALIYAYTGNFKKSSKYFKLALESTQALEYKRGESYNRNYYGELLILLGRYEEALENLQVGLQYADEIHATRPKVLLLSNIGRVYDYFGTEKANEYLKKSYLLAKQMKTPRETHLCALYLGIYYIFNRELKKAEKVLNHGLNLNNPQTNSLMKLYYGLVRLLQNQKDESIQEFNYLIKKYSNFSNFEEFPKYLPIMNYYSYNIAQLIMACLQNNHKIISKTLETFRNSQERLGKNLILQVKKIVQILEELFPKLDFDFRT
ncbi:MAG: TIR domain-containing protein [Promethearchaeota archaeon]|nr:MAG: TIR domain-containing protein [Candidatus Lokiarchaeota archaeon]